MSCKSCPHGPYWYQYWREGKRVRKRYIGKVNPFGGRDRTSEEKARVDPPPPPENADDIFDRRRASLSLALRLLGLVSKPTMRELKLLWRTLAMKLHPDRGGDEKGFARASAAYSYVQAAI